MQLVKVRIRRGNPKLGENQMMYPARFDPYEVMSSGSGHIHGRYGYSGHIGLGGSEEWTIIGIDDDLAVEYAKDPDMEIITSDEADKLIEDWRIMRGDPAEVVNDAARLQAIAAKQTAGITLTAEDLDALDPDGHTPGISKLRSTADLLDLANGVTPVKRAKIGEQSSNQSANKG